MEKAFKCEMTYPTNHIAIKKNHKATSQLFVGFCELQTSPTSTELESLGVGPGNVKFKVLMHSLGLGTPV